MPLDLDLAVKVGVPLGTLVLGKYLDRLLTKRSKLISYLGHASAFKLRGDTPGIVHTHSIVVRNAGRLAASNVRIGHFVFPEHFQIFPVVPHSIDKSEDGVVEIVIAKLVPEEQVTISYLYFPPLVFGEIHAYTKSDEGFAKILKALPTPQYPKWVSHLIWSLVFIGAIAVVYLAVDLIRRLVS